MSDGAAPNDGDELLPFGRPYTYIYLLHFDGIGCIALASKDGNGKFQNRLLTFHDCLSQTTNLCGDRDWYLSPNAFRPGRRRRNEDVISVRASWIDLDYYRSEMAGSPAGVVWKNAQSLLERAGIPVPQMVVSTGRGLQLLWLYPNGLPVTCAPRWAAIQSALVDLFGDFGSDRAASNLCGVLRLPGTINTKSGQPTGFVHLDIDNRVDFEDLCHRVLPLVRPKYIQGQDITACQPRLQKSSSARAEANRRMAAVVVQDIERLLRGRGPDHRPKTSRDLSAFIYGTYLLRALGRRDFRDRFMEWASSFTSLTPAQRRDLARAILSFKRRYSTEGAAACLGVTEDEVVKFELQRLLPAGARSDRERRQRRLEGNRQYNARVRKAKGDRPQSESLQATKPWESMSISRSTYYRYVKGNESSNTDPWP